MLYKTILSGLLSLSLTACGTVYSDPHPALAAAPTELLAPTPEPDEPTERSNGALVNYIKELRRALQSSNDDKAGVLQWFKEML